MTTKPAEEVHVYQDPTDPPHRWRATSTTVPNRVYTLDVAWRPLETEPGRYTPQVTCNCFGGRIENQCKHAKAVAAQLPPRRREVGRIADPSGNPVIATVDDNTGARTSLEHQLEQSLSQFAEKAKQEALDRGAAHQRERGNPVTENTRVDDARQVAPIVAPQDLSDEEHAELMPVPVERTSSRGFAPDVTTIQSYQALATVLSTAYGVVPAGFENNPAKVAAVMFYGWEMGVGPMTALTEIAIVNGRPLPSARLMIGKVRAEDPTAVVEYLVYTHEEVHARLYRRGRLVADVSYSLADAIKAGQYKEEWKAGNHTTKEATLPWRIYTRDMLAAACIRRLVRLGAQDLQLGVIPSGMGAGALLGPPPADTLIPERAGPLTINDLPFDPYGGEQQFRLALEHEMKRQKVTHAQVTNYLKTDDLQKIAHAARAYDGPVGLVAAIAEHFHQVRTERRDNIIQGTATESTNADTATEWTVPPEQPTEEQDEAQDDDPEDLPMDHDNPRYTPPAAAKEPPVDDFTREVIAETERAGLSLGDLSVVLNGPLNEQRIARWRAEHPKATARELVSRAADAIAAARS